MNQTANERKQLAHLTGRPPTSGVGHGLDGQALSSLTSKAAAPSKWSINIQEIVKRTQKNLERGHSGSLASADRRNGVNTEGDLQYLSKHMKLGFGSSSTKDKSSLLYHDLKKKLTYESGPQQVSGDISAGMRRKDNLLSLGGQQNSAKTIRPTSVNNNPGLYLGGQQKSAATLGVSSGLQDRLAIARLKRRTHEDGYSQELDQNQYRQESNAQSLNDISATTGSIQGGQGGPDLYQDNMNSYGQNNQTTGLSIQERSLVHQRTLMQAGRLNLIGTDEEPDDEAQIVSQGHTRYEFRRHNSNMNRPTAFHLEIQDQQEILHDLDDSQAIVEAGTNEEHTQRHGNHSQESFQEDTGPLTTNNLISHNTAGGTLKLNQLRPSNSTGATNMMGTFTDTQVKRQTTQLKGKLAQNGANVQVNSNAERRQKIFEEEIIKRIKEIQRYVKSLHLQIKKTQAGHEKLKEECDSDKDVLLSVQQALELQTKKLQADKLKQVTSGELESHMRDADNRYNEKLVLVVQEAADQTLKQVKDEIVPDVRLKMYDSITEETNRLKLDVDYSMQSFKREFNDQTKKDRLKNNELIEQEITQLKKEVLSEQSSQTLQILAQVDAQIAKALKDSSQRFLPQTEMLTMRSEILEKMNSNEQQIKDDMRNEMHKLNSSGLMDLERKLTQLQSTSKDQLAAKIQSLAPKFVTPESLNDKLQSLRHELDQMTKMETQKAADQHKALFVSAQKLQTDLARAKKDVDQQLKTALEEAKFDTVQMVQSDIVEMNNQAKITKEKMTELQNSSDEIKSKLEESIMRLSNREKEQAALQMHTERIQDQQTNFNNKLENLSADVREMKAIQESPSKKQSAQEQLDSYRSAPGTSAIALEEIEGLRSEIKLISDNCNQVSTEVTEVKAIVTSNKSGVENQLKTLRTSVDEFKKQVVDVQFEISKNKKFLEDQLAEMSRNTDGLQIKILKGEQSSYEMFSGLRSEHSKLMISSEDQFEKLHADVAKLEEQQASLKHQESTIIPATTAQTTDASGGKDDRLYLQQQEAIDEVVEKMKQTKLAVNVVETRLDELESKQASGGRGSSEIRSLQTMLSTLSERNGRLEDDLQSCSQQSKLAFNKTETLSMQVDECQASIKSLKEEGVQVAIDTSKDYVQSLTLVKKEDLDALSQMIDELRQDTDQKLEDLKSQPRTSNKQSDVQWQESSVKKVEAKKNTGWAEVRMTKIEVKEQTIRSSTLEQQMVSAAPPQNNLNSIPPKTSDEEQMPFAQPHSENGASKQSLSNSEQQLQTPEKTNSLQKQQQQLAGHESSQPLMNSMTFDKDEGRDQMAAGATVSNVDDYERQINSHSGMRKPTEYSASVEQQPTGRRDHREIQVSESELEIKSPVQFEMMPESDVKVNETNSSQANLLIQDRIAFDDDNNFNDQIISPSEGMHQVPNNAEFYKLQREVRSNQVQKKNDLAIRVQVDQEVESQKVDSPKPLDSGVFDDNEDDHDNDSGDDGEASEQPDSQQKPQSSKLHLPESQQADDYLAGLNASSSGLLLQQQIKGVSTTAQLDIVDRHSQLNEQTQLFRTQKMSGLAMLSQMATQQQQLECLDEADQELQQRFCQDNGSVLSSAQKELMPPSISESEENFEGIPACSSVVLGMKLGDHLRKNSDGKSSMMGLSAFGLESHRESLENLPELVKEEKMIDNAHVQISILKDGEDGEDVEDDQTDSQGQEDDNVMKIVQMLVSNEIQDALRLMNELNHPGMNTDS